MTEGSSKPGIADGAILLGTVCLMGAPEVLGPKISHFVGETLFWSGLGSLIAFLTLRWGTWLWHRMAAKQAIPEKSNEGISAGRDNAGIQAVVHGPATFNHMPLERPKTKTEQKTAEMLAKAALIDAERKHHKQITREPLAVQPLAFEYDNSANDNSKVTVFRRAFTFFPDGVPVKHDVVRKEFYVGLTNSSGRTLRNARIVLDGGERMIGPIYSPLLSHTTRTDRTDIQPRATELFLFGSGLDTDSEAGMYRPIIRAAPEIEALSRKIGPSSVGLTFGTIDGSPRSLLRNDDDIVYLTAYADDTEPAKATFKVNAKTRLEVIVLNNESLEPLPVV